jgi:hypothetical protein
VPEGSREGPVLPLVLLVDLKGFLGKWKQVISFCHGSMDPRQSTYREERFISALGSEVLVHSQLVHCFGAGTGAVCHAGEQRAQQTTHLMAEHKEEEEGPVLVSPPDWKTSTGLCLLKDSTTSQYCKFGDQAFNYMAFGGYSRSSHSTEEQQRPLRMWVGEVLKMLSNLTNKTLTPA